MWLSELYSNVTTNNSFRLLTEYHSFLFKKVLTFNSEYASFRLLTEYHSFLFNGEIKGIELVQLCKFPSPYGVSFILIQEDIIYNHYYDVISFRLLTEYHSFLLS